MSDDKLFDLHRESIVDTLAKLEADSGDKDDTVSIGKQSLHTLLRQLFELRWQNRTLQARGTELLNDYRDMKRTTTAVLDVLDAAGVDRTEHGLSDMVQSVLDDLHALQGRFKKLQDFSDEQADG